jgi:hypothetical protein
MTIPYVHGVSGEGDGSLGGLLCNVMDNEGAAVVGVAGGVEETDGEVPDLEVLDLFDRLCAEALSVAVVSLR